MLSNIANHFQHLGDLRRLLAEIAYRSRGLVHFVDQLTNPINRQIHLFLRDSNLAVSRLNRLRGRVSVARHFARRGAHFSHRSDNFIGL
ncbi:Uncharacterised protein [Vibrio cholerae]|nr:Uncharacterised protein [Vibrio cholerae]CSC51004.1 Uncharacterised protein [Vibrio cholerae]